MYALDFSKKYTQAQSSTRYGMDLNIIEPVPGSSAKADRSYY